MDQGINALSPIEETMMAAMTVAETTEIKSRWLAFARLSGLVCTKPCAHARKILLAHQNAAH
jgi:hypothetical protein